MQLDRLKDSELVERVLDGHDDAFAVLMERYAAMVTACLALGERFGGAGEDLQQEAFLLAYRRLGKLRRREKFGPWLWKIAYNVRADFLRQQQRRPANAASGPPPDGADISSQRADPGAGPAEQVSFRETQSRVLEAINNMPETYRTVLHMRLLGEEPPNVIAARLGLKESTVRMRLQRGLERLRKRIGPLGE